MASWHHPVYQTVSQKDPCDPRNVICKPYLLSLIFIPMQAKLNKSPLTEPRDPLPLRGWSALSPRADHVLVDSFSSTVARRALLEGAPRCIYRLFSRDRISKKQVAGFIRLSHCVYRNKERGRCWGPLHVGSETVAPHKRDLERNL